MLHAVKMAAGADDLIEGIAIPNGGVFNGKDLDGEYFTKSTDLCLEWFGPGERPLLYHHGIDTEAGTTVVGRVSEYKSTDKGVWAQVQLDRQNEYFEAIASLVAEGKLYFSSGAMAHLVKRTKAGEITKWPWVELSLTPTPANLLAELDFATAEKHFEAAGTKSAKMDEIRSALAAVKDIPDGPTLMSDDDGGCYPEGSYEDLAEDIASQLRTQTQNYAYVVATFDGYAIVRCCGDDDNESAVTDDGYSMPEMSYYRVAYTLNADGEPILGEMQRVEPAMVPAKAALTIPQTDEAPLAIQSARLSDYAALVIARTKDVQDRRIKEGRVLSTANRERLATTREALEGAMKALSDLLDATEPQPAKAASAADVDRPKTSDRGRFLALSTRLRSHQAA